MELRRPWLSDVLRLLHAGNGSHPGRRGRELRGGPPGRVRDHQDPTRPDVDALRVLMGPFTVYNIDNVEEAAG